MSWGSEGWGISPWGGEYVPLDCPPADPPLQIIVREPAPNAIDVLPGAVGTVTFFDSNNDLNPSTLQLSINGIAVYGGGQFLNQFVGVVTPGVGITTIQFRPPLGWDYSTRYTLSTSIFNNAGQCVEGTWFWDVIPDPICYTGLTPLPIEIAMQSPLQILLSADVMRRLLLDFVLRQGKVIHERGNKAARVVYQLAFSTELSTIHNLYVPRDEDALKTIVCEREKTIIIDQRLKPYDTHIRAMAAALVNRGIITDRYVVAFNDYLDSTNYEFRVSTVANLVMLSTAFELQELA